MSNKTTFSTVDLEEFCDMIELFKRERVSTSILENLSDAYQIQLPKYSLSDLMNLAKNIEERSKKSGTQKAIEECQMAAGHWFLGQKSLFFCVLSLYSNLKRINIETITEEQLQPLRKIFVSKTSKMLMFEVKHLLSIGLNSQWEKPDIQLLQEIMNFSKNDQVQSGSYIIRWKKIAYELFLRSDSGYFYSARDCRNKWMSHLSPNINKNRWTAEEQLYLWHLIREFGCKWALISRKMGGIRTEHMVKNKANSIMRVVFKKKMKTLKEKHIQQVIEALQKRISIKVKQELAIVDHRLQEQREIYQVLQQRQNKEELISIKRTMVEFGEPFSEQRLIIIHDSEQENWQYEQKPLYLDYSCFLSLN